MPRCDIGNARGFQVYMPRRHTSSTNTRAHAYFSAACKLSSTCAPVSKAVFLRSIRINATTNLELNLGLGNILLAAATVGNLLCLGDLASHSLGVNGQPLRFSGFSCGEKPLEALFQSVVRVSFLHRR